MSIMYVHRVNTMVYNIAGLCKCSLVPVFLSLSVLKPPQLGGGGGGLPSVPTGVTTPRRT